MTEILRCDGCRHTPDEILPVEWIQIGLGSTGYVADACSVDCAIVALQVLAADRVNLPVELQIAQRAITPGPETEVPR